ncbi:hypothetical protein BDZ94DRAFT_1280842 [Collybia nuda]|uniref:Selenoprotein O n=1 Tax=Collybia nuda TaxID=64659 RepID=A0A9P5YCZ0_9AGAR|nr:hypothetical protein BDZ94DRAFT_1280842 [Collybia nuda]
MGASAKTQKFVISKLPLPPRAQLLTHRLTPDTHTPSVTEFQSKVLTSGPSLLRRARLLSPQCHFSFVTPMPIAFPYNIEPPVPPEVVEDKGAYIEKWLSKREAVHQCRNLSDSPLGVYVSECRDQPRELIGISETGLRDCVPHLQVGDAFGTLGTPSLASTSDLEGNPVVSDSEDLVSARQEFIDILSGHHVLMSAPDSEIPFAPWSLRYSGHQFGSWAGQLGDGRAISILATPHPSDPELTYEIQLKGSGRTPFSRSADGLAVLRSSIREYLCSEAMQALSIPTTRSLSLVSLPALHVVRERMETACVMARMAPSFIRLGSFEALNGPTNMFFFGGGQQNPDWEALRILGEWVSSKVLKLDCAPGEAWGKKLVLEVAQRNSEMVAAWQAYGFMHGVINTDNVSILGLTIDYGPYSFMDVFNRSHICNHTDGTGRYAYRHQPDMVLFALRALLNSLAPLIGAENEFGGKAVSPGWAENVSIEKLEEWKNSGLKLQSELERLFQEVTSNEYDKLMRKRLALRRGDPTDESQHFGPLLDIMEEHKLDYHSTFRTLASFKPSMLNLTNSCAEDSFTPLEDFIKQLLASTSGPERLDFARGTNAWITWLDKYGRRIRDEKAEWPEDMDAERERVAKAANPRFVLRQWVLEEVIGKVERDHASGKRLLAKVMHMACNPFEPWGAEGDERPEIELGAEEKEEKRYCGMGDKTMLGFQCSCSS